MAGLSSLLLPVVAVTATAAPAPGAKAALDYYFVDRRFAAAVFEAGALPRGLQPIRVDTDALEWDRLLANDRAPRTLRGLTTEAFFFDLRRRLAGKVRDSQISRVGPGLHLWTMRCVNP